MMKCGIATFSFATCHLDSRPSLHRHLMAVVALKRLLDEGYSDAWPVGDNVGRLCESPMKVTEIKNGRGTAKRLIPWRGSQAGESRAEFHLSLKSSDAVLLKPFKSSLPVPSTGMVSISAKLSSEGIKMLGKPCSFR